MRGHKLSFSIEQASLAHSQAVVGLHKLVWSDEALTPDQFSLCIKQPTHRVHIACPDIVVGYVSGFMTRTAKGGKRWEVDLLAVHPDYRGQGIAQALVRASVQAGKEQGAAFSRALTQVENHAVHSTFQRVGFTTEHIVCELFVSSANREDELASQSVAHLIPVNTLTYNGIWIEADYSEAALKAGQHKRSQLSYDVAGVVIPIDSTDEIATAKQLGYEIINQYIWWTQHNYPADSR